MMLLQLSKDFLTSTKSCADGTHIFTLFKSAESHPSPATNRVVFRQLFILDTWRGACFALILGFLQNLLLGWSHYCCIK